MTPDHLTAQELADETGTTAERIAALVEAGVLHPIGEGFRTGDIQRVVVAEAMEQSGLSLELMRRGIDAGFISFAQTDEVYPVIGRLGPTVEALAGEAGISTDGLLRIITAFGLPRPEPNSRLRQPDADQLLAFTRAWLPLGDEELLVRAARGYGEALRRAAESWLELFVEAVLVPVSGRPMTWDQMSKHALTPGFPILGVGRQMLPWLLDQHRIPLLHQLNLDSIQAQMALFGIAAQPAREPSAMVFADMAGFTSLTEERGDEVAASAATRLAELANDVAQRHDGRLVKLLGDGVMLHFPRPADAVPAALALRDEVAAAGLPPTHTGIDAGSVIRRESDFFGRTVNIAARLSAQAGAGEVLLTRAVLEAAGEAPNLAGVEELPPLTLKGIPEPVTAFRLR
jgi:class 3 adenylate cyclase